MNTETTLPQGGSDSLPENTHAAPASPAPRNDAEAALQQENTQQETPEQKAEREEGEKRRNRTKEYIDRKNREVADLRARLARYEAGGGGQAREAATPTAGDKEPTLEDFDYDITAFNKAHAKWAVDAAMNEREQRTKQAEDGRKQQEVLAAYQDRAAAFAEDHPDFTVVVDSIPYQLSNEVQAAIMAHERGPEIAYHIANNDDDAFSLSNVLPHVAAAAVERLAKRITAAPQKPEPQGTNSPNQLATPTNPVTRAPRPAATVTGRSQAETPPEKLTDDEWYRRDKESRRKR